MKKEFRKISSLLIGAAMATGLVSCKDVMEKIGFDNDGSKNEASVGTNNQNVSGNLVSTQEVVLYEGVEIATIDQSSDALKISFEKEATKDKVQKLVESISYKNTKGTEAHTGEREIDLSISDGDGASTHETVAVKINP